MTIIKKNKRWKVPVIIGGLCLGLPSYTCALWSNNFCSQGTQHSVEFPGKKYSSTDTPYITAFWGGPPLKNPDPLRQLLEATSPDESIIHKIWGLWASKYKLTMQPRLHLTFNSNASGIWHLNTTYTYSIKGDGVPQPYTYQINGYFEVKKLNEDRVVLNLFTPGRLWGGYKFAEIAFENFENENPKARLISLENRGWVPGLTYKEEYKSQPNVQVTKETITKNILEEGEEGTYQNATSH